VINLEKIREDAQAQGVSIHLVLKEQIHLLILDHLFQKGAFPEMVFQGGTALRIAYRGVRYSEDLDFVLRKKDHPLFHRLPEILEGLAPHLERFPPFGSGVTLKVQKRTPAFQRFILTVPVEELRLLDRTHIEVANVPSYESDTVLVRREEVLVTPAICVETPREILSDKLTAFGSRGYLKGRDLWDLYFLTDTLGLAVDDTVRTLVKRKISDYRLGHQAFVTRFGEHLATLRTRGRAVLETEMDRFLPVSYRTLFRAKATAIVGTASEALTALYNMVRRE